MYNISPGHLAELQTVNEKPCVSIYLPTHASHPDNLQDPIRFRNLLKEAEESLLQLYSAEESRKILEPFHVLAGEEAFWQNAGSGLAVLGSASRFDKIILPIEMPELAIVAESFHTKPLRKFLQSMDRFHVLGINMHEFRLYEGNRHSISEITIPEEIPSTIEAALGEELTEEHLTVASYGGVRHGGKEAGNAYHGHGGKKDEVDKDRDRFFRVAAEMVAKYYSNPSGLPLILAALPEHHHHFQKLANNTHLLEETIPYYPGSVSKEELLKNAWEVLNPVYEERLREQADRFMVSKSGGLGTDVKEEAAKAAAEGRVDTLLIEQDRIIPGMVDAETGAVRGSSIDQPQTDDLLDDLAELVTARGGKVWVLPEDKMPARTGLAAIYRY